MKVEEAVNELLESSPGDGGDEPWMEAHQVLVRHAQQVTRKLTDHPSTGDLVPVEEDSEVDEEVRRMLEPQKHVCRTVRQVIENPGEASVSTRVCRVN